MGAQIIVFAEAAQRIRRTREADPVAEFAASWARLVRATTPLMWPGCLAAQVMFAAGVALIEAWRRR